jgi:hypothetical protein
MGISAISSSTATELTTLAQLQSSSASVSASKASQPAAPKVGAAGGGAKPASSSTSTSSSSSSAKIYDVRDTNKDGVVSYEEAMLYEITHPTAETENQSSVSSNKLQTGLKAYQKDQQTGNTSQSSLLSEI